MIEDEHMSNDLAALKSSQSDQLVEQMREAHMKFKAEQRAKLAQAKQNSPDKQPFEVEAFGNISNLRSDDGALRITPEEVEELEIEYYVGNPNLKSMQEFADRKKELDRNNAG